MMMMMLIIYWILMVNSFFIFFFSEIDTFFVVWREYWHVTFASCKFGERTVSRQMLWNQQQHRQIVDMHLYLILRDVKVRRGRNEVASAYASKIIHSWLCNLVAHACTHSLFAHGNVYRKIIIYYFMQAYLGPILLLLKCN